LLLEVAFDECFVRYDSIFNRLVDLNHFKVHGLTNISIVIDDGLHIDLRAGEEGFKALNIDDQATFCFTDDGAAYNGFALIGINDAAPCLEQFRFSAGEPKPASFIFFLFNINVNRVTNIDIIHVAEFS